MEYGVVSPVVGVGLFFIYISPPEIRTRRDLHTLILCPCVYCQLANVVWSH